MKRENGWYWVKIRGNIKELWVIAEFDSDNWFYQGCCYEDKHFIAIDENRIERKSIERLV